MIIGSSQRRVPPLPLGMERRREECWNAITWAEKGLRCKRQVRTSEETSTESREGEDERKERRWEEKAKKRQKKRIPNKRIGPRTRRAVDSGVLANAKTLDRESIVALLFYFAASSKTRNNNRTLLFSTVVTSCKWAFTTAAPWGREHNNREKNFRMTVMGYKGKDWIEINKGARFPQHCTTLLHLHLHLQL